MNLFHLHIEKDQGEILRPTTWLVIAGNLFDAMSSVPEGYSVKQSMSRWALSRIRVIARIAAPTMH